MSNSIYEDALIRPDLYLWFGIDIPSFETWLVNATFRVHPGIVDFWRKTGGGDVFESETLLGPLRDEVSENVMRMTEYHWSRGLPQTFVLFNVGSFLSAFRIDKPLIVTLRDSSYDVIERFHTFHDWYDKTLRLEFSNRYGLPR